MHYAAFHGNITLIKYFISNGGNMLLTNRHKINMIHVAAQGDQPISISFFKDKGLDVNGVDGKYSTPLHWACYSG